MPKPDSTAALGADPQSLLARLPTYLHVSDIQGLTQLATQGVLGVAGLGSVALSIFRFRDTPGVAYRQG